MRIQKKCSVNNWNREIFTRIYYSNVFEVLRSLVMCGKSEWNNQCREYWSSLQLESGLLRQVRPKSKAVVNLTNQKCKQILIVNK